MYIPGFHTGFFIGGGGGGGNTTCWCYNKTPLSLGGSGGMPPRKFLNLRAFLTAFLDPYFNKNKSRYGSLAVCEFTPVSITITYNNIYIYFFLAGEGDLVLGGTSQGSPLLNRTLYTVM